MSKDQIVRPIQRRTILKAGLAIGAMQVASPFVVKSLADDPVKIGLDNPLTGTYAALGKNELIGCQLALDQINAKGGILGRKAELLIEDSHQRRCRHRRGKGAQADRPRQGQLSARQHQLGVGCGDGQRVLRKRRVPRRSRWPHRSQSPGQTATGTCSAFATRRRWKATRSRRRSSRPRARNGTISRPTMRSAIPCRPAWRKRPQSSAAPRWAAT